jgi:hypothetical protein
LIIFAETSSLGYEGDSPFIPAEDVLEKEYSNVRIMRIIKASDFDITLIGCFFS